VLVVVASLALAPAAGAAGRGHSGRSGPAVAAFGHAQNVSRQGHLATTGQITRQWYPSGHHGSHHFGRRHAGNAFVSAWVAAPAVIYAPSPLYGPSAAYEPPVYYDPPMAYPPPSASMVSLAPSPPPAPPMPSVVQYPTGRYELRGDGILTPYTWVWIPNPPPSPPPGPPAAPPASVDSSRARVGKLYRWTDDEGVAHWTDRWEAVPQRYRAEAKPPER
jgi:hypothetical protein